MTIADVVVKVDVALDAMNNDKSTAPAAYDAAWTAAVDFYKADPSKFDELLPVIRALAQGRNRRQEEFRRGKLHVEWDNSIIAQCVIPKAAACFYPELKARGLIVGR